ncbi:MAG: 4Fe-4S binding protein [Deltaproteobacteria bacterium]
MERARRRIQLLSLLLANSYWLFPWKDRIFQGWTKRICFPGLNCYSCPAAAFSCPLGGLQNAIAGIRPAFAVHQFHFGAYVLGTIGIFGSLMGRIPCGWFCPFGYLQEWLYRIPIRKFSLPRIFRWGPYLFLLFFVVLLPLFWVDEMGFGSTWFCKFVCPAGTLGAGLPLLAMETGLRRLVGTLFFSKLAVLLAILTGCVVTNRFFCRTICPLGALFGLFNRVSLLRLRFDSDRCVQCSACKRICPVGVSFFDRTDSINTGACIRCMRCYSICPAGAVSVEPYDMRGHAIREGEGRS